MTTPISLMRDTCSVNGSGSTARPRLTVRAATDAPSIRSDWSELDPPTIEGVAVREIRSVVTGTGTLTEMWRQDWQLDPHGVDQVFIRTLAAGELSAWHVHLETTDRLFCATGDALIVLFDARCDSSTCGAVRELRIGEHRPAVVTVPPGVVHGIKSLGAPVLLVNAVDRAYRYDGPDHHRLPPDSGDVPYRF